MSPTRSSTLARASWPFAALVFVAVFAAYWPALHAGFIWDDDAHLTRPALRSLDGLRRIWFEPGATQQYYPVLHSLFWIEQRLWGDAAFGYHCTNVALHAVAALLFALVLRRLSLPAAWFAALVFALHPVHVESVAWISEQKNTLSAIFCLLAMLAYLRFDEARRPAAYLAASACFLVGLLTKTVVATLPAALLVLFWWQRGAVTWRDVRPLLPWFALAIVAGTFTAFVEQKLIGAEGGAHELTLGQRGVLAGRVPWFYLGKLAWPEALTFFYPRWSLDAAALRSWAPLAALVVLAALLWKIRGTRRGPFAALLLFTGTLFPVLGWLNVYPFIYSFVADHFQYLASLAVIALVSSGLARGGNSARAVLLAGVACLPALGLLTYQQSRVYQDARTLYRATLARNPASWIASNNLGKELLADKSQLAAAIAWFERALILRPDYAEAQNNLGLALTQIGRPGEAIPHLEASLRLKPDVYQTHNNLGIALAGSGRAAEAVRAFQRAAALNPRLPNLHENWAKALVLLGDRAAADEQFALAARLRAGAGATPTPPSAHPKPP